MNINVGFSGAAMIMDITEVQPPKRDLGICREFDPVLDELMESEHGRDGITSLSIVLIEDNARHHECMCLILNNQQLLLEQLNKFRPAVDRLNRERARKLPSPFQSGLSAGGIEIQAPAPAIYIIGSWLEKIKGMERFHALAPKRPGGEAPTRQKLVIEYIGELG